MIELLKRKKENTTQVINGYYFDFKNMDRVEVKKINKVFKMFQDFNNSDTLKKLQLLDDIKSILKSLKNSQGIVVFESNKQAIIKQSFKKFYAELLTYLKEIEKEQVNNIYREFYIKG